MYKFYEFCFCAYPSHIDGRRGLEPMKTQAKQGAVSIRSGMLHFVQHDGGYERTLARLDYSFCQFFKDMLCFSQFNLAIMGILAGIFNAGGNFYHLKFSPAV